MRHTQTEVNNRRNTRSPVLILAFVCLLACCAVVSVVGPHRTGRKIGKSHFPLLSVIKTFDAPGFKSARFDCGSGQLLVFYTDDKVRAFSRAGDQLYCIEVPPSSSVVPSVDGRCALVFADRNPTDTELSFLDLQGRPIWDMKVDGAVWCADSCKGDGEARFVVGTGKGFVYVIDIGRTRRRYRRWRAPGAVVSVAARTNGEEVLIASWQKSVLRKANLRGRKLWETALEPAALSSVKLLSRSKKVYVETWPVKSGEDGAYAILDDSGRKVFGGRISVQENTRVCPGPGGEFVCCGVSKLITHQGKSMWERHAVLMDKAGRKLWEKGSPFFQAAPLTVTRKGYVVLSDGKSSLFVTSPAGEMRSSVKLQSAMRGCTASSDGSRLLINCKDGKLVLLEVSQ